MNKKALSHLLILSGSLLGSSQLWAEDASSHKTPGAIVTIEQAQDDPDQIQTLYRNLDEDSVQDRLDQCQNSLIGVAVDEHGCERDSDKDGIYDRVDQCPDTLAGAKVNFLGCEEDTDKDRVIDRIDRCPNTPLGTPVDAYGCPIEIDSDSDGVIDREDQCPDTPEGAEVNRYGCEPQMFSLSNIVFNTGSYTIRADQKPILDRDISRLKEVEGEEVVLISGHTDTQGSAASNVKLSWNRAKSTKDYLVENFGYDADKIYLNGHGEAKPVATNDTSAGRQQNRRIELEVMPPQKLPSGAQKIMPEPMKHYNRYQP
ncbi:MAG: OmpA family protein [Hydrogenovibrio sp.]|uniref:OmpA family protein n=1 Tax=Hydrogenovibrio sp. TaxID=2065821 RepID=UPI0028706316|nr:OmpA family protein [Hydrogenovibrio sp.]MDR9498393.1 OmpA family protein [Hydrogenovibrio sp.]